jgi:hypothetical protein
MSLSPFNDEEPNVTHQHWRELGEAQQRIHRRLMQALASRDVRTAVDDSGIEQALPMIGPRQRHQH